VWLAAILCTLAAAFALPTATASAEGVSSATALSRPAAAVSFQQVAAQTKVTPRGLCGKRVYSSRYFKADTARAIVRIFINAVRAGKGASAALGTALSATGVGALVGGAVTVLGWVAGDFIINLVEHKLLKQFDHYRRVRFQLHVECKAFLVYPKLRLGAKLR
jgi:hypothetical protein